MEIMEVAKSLIEVTTLVMIGVGLVITFVGIIRSYGD